MIHRTLKSLAQMSYNKGLLNEESVKQVAEKLNRKDLKVFIRFLKDEEKKHEVYVTSAQTLTSQDKEKLQSLYSSKKVIFSTDPAMVSGIKIVENDQEYEVNLNRTFHDIMRFLSTK